MSTTKWSLDPTHSEVLFKIKHLMITNVTGSFGTYNVVAESDDDNFANPKISFSADISSINTNNADRDAHLKSADFFEAETYPQLTFEATRFENVGGGDFALYGNLTIKGVSKSIKLDVEFGGIGKDPWGNVKAGFSISGKINRKDFGLEWNAPLEAGGVLVGEEVKLNAEIQLVKQA